MFLWLLTFYQTGPNGLFIFYQVFNLILQSAKKANYKLADKVGESAWACHTIKYHKITGFNADGWLAGSGDGFYYVPVKKNVKGKKVNALRVGEGAGNYLSYYAYKSRKLVK